MSTRTTMTLPHLGTAEVHGDSALLQDRQCRVMVGLSVKNRLIDEDFLTHAIRFMRTRSEECTVAIFDKPYAFNSAALENRSTPTAEEFYRADRIGDEKERMTARIIRREGADNVTICRWPEFETKTIVQDFRRELVDAVAINGDLEASLLDNVRSWSGDAPMDRFGSVWLGFQLSEIPIVCYLYYVAHHRIDVYPGMNFPFYRELENGHWSSHLPRLSQLAETNPHCFVRVPHN